MRTRIKICGLTNLADALAAAAAGADYLGFVFVPESRRQVTPSQVREIVAALPDGVMTVGVFVNQSPDEVNAVMRTCRLDVAQLHGDEAPEVAEAVGVHRVWKAFSLLSPQDLERAAGYPSAAVVADTSVKGQRGGTGLVGDWELAAQLAARRPLVLAGGLAPENVGAAIRRVRPVAVDTSSGVEVSPGRKAPARVKAFVDAVRAEVRQGAVTSDERRA